MLHTRRRRGLVLIAVALVVALGALGVARYSEARADDQAQEVGSELAGVLDNWDTADEYRADAMTGPLPALGGGTTIAVDGDALIASRTVQVGMAVRCVTVRAAPTGRGRQLDSGPLAIADGRC